MSLEQPRVGAMPPKALFASACPPHVLRRRALPRRQRNSPATRRDGVPTRHDTAALSTARYALFGRISKSHGIAPTTSYIGTLKALQPLFMSAMTPGRLLSTFGTFLQIFKKSSFDRGEACRISAVRPIWVISKTDGRSTPKRAQRRVRQWWEWDPARI